MKISQDVFLKFSTKSVTFADSVFALSVFPFLCLFRPAFQVCFVVGEGGEDWQKEERSAMDLTISCISLHLSFD